MWVPSPATGRCTGCNLGQAKRRSMTTHPGRTSDFTFDVGDPTREELANSWLDGDCGHVTTFAGFAAVLCSDCPTRSKNLGLPSA